MDLAKGGARAGWAAGLGGVLVQLVGWSACGRVEVSLAKQRPDQPASPPTELYEEAGEQEREEEMSIS